MWTSSRFTDTRITIRWFAMCILSRSWSQSTPRTCAPCWLPTDKALSPYGTPRAVGAASQDLSYRFESASSLGGALVPDALVTVRKTLLLELLGRRHRGGVEEKTITRAFGGARLGDAPRKGVPWGTEA